MFRALHATSQTLTGFLGDTLASVLPDFFGAGSTWEVTTNTPEEMRDSTEGLSFWLYRVVRDEHVLNQPRRRVDPGRLEHQPLPLRLHYLATPIVASEDQQSHEAEHLILGTVLQSFHDTPRFRGAQLQGAFEDTDVTIHVRLEPMDLEEITRVWEALQSSYQLSVSYEVSLVNVESARQPDAMTPVDRFVPEVSIITGESP